MKLIDQWEEIKSIIEDKVIAFIQEQKDLPKVFYEVTPNGQFKEFPILKVVHFNSNQSLYYSGKKPTREDIRRIQGYYYNLELDTKNFRFQYDHAGNSRSLQQIEEYNNLFLDKAVAESKAKEITDRIAEEERLLTNGHERCQRCRKVVPKEQIITHTIIGRGRKTVYNSWKNRYEDKACVTQEPMKFCSGECAAHEQMSRED